MTAKETRRCQAEFFKLVREATITLEDLLEGLGVDVETFALWLRKRDFRIRLHATARYLRRSRDLQLEMAAHRAADILAHASTGSAKAGTSTDATTPVARAACADLIRLARDSRARKSAHHPPADEMNKRRKLYHPDVPDDVAKSLAKALAGGEPETIEEE